VLLSKRTLGDLRMGWAMADAWRGTSLSNFRLMNISCACVRLPGRTRRMRACSVLVAAILRLTGCAAYVDCER
jgi:hypothetical protein